MRADFHTLITNMLIASEAYKMLRPKIVMHSEDLAELKKDVENTINKKLKGPLNYNGIPVRASKNMPIGEVFILDDTYDLFKKCK